jgi:outer membrane protein, heavy metal efflux system
MGLLRRSGVVMTFAAAALAAVPARADAQQTTPAPLTLAGAMQRALEANPDIAAARLARAVSNAAVNVAAERPNPEVSYEIAKETPKQSLTGVFPIELGGKRGSRIDLAKAGAATGEAAINQVIAAVRADVRRAYFASVAADRRLALAQDLRDLAVRVRDATKARFEAGDVPEVELVQTEVALSSVDNEVTGATGDVTATRAELNALLGWPASAPLTLADTLTSGDVPTADAAVAQALQGNAELAVLDRRLVEQQFRRAVAKSMRTPDLAAGPSLTWDAQPEFSVGWRASVAVTVPVFTTHKAGLALEDAELARLRGEREALAARVAAAVFAAVARASAAQQQVQRYEQETLPRVAVLERMAQDGYAAGQTGLVVLIQALQQARETRQRSLQAGLDFQSALADLERAMGTAGKQ